MEKSPSEKAEALVKQSSVKKRTSKSSGSIFDLQDSIQKPPEDDTSSAGSSSADASAAANVDLAKLRTALAQASKETKQNEKPSAQSD